MELTGMDKQPIQELRKTTNLYEWAKDAQKMSLADIFVISPMIQEAIDVIAYCHHNSKYFKKAQCGYIIGDTGAGKTTLCDYYVSKYPRYDYLGEETIERIVPVLYTIVPATTTTKSLATAILAALGDPLFHQGTEQFKTDRIGQLIEKSKVELIILDEAQHIFDRESQKVIYTCTNWIKNIIEKTQTPIILVGLEELTSVIEANPQLKSRFERHKVLKPLGMDDSDKECSLRKFLKVVDMKLPLPKSSNLDDPGLVTLIHGVSSGSPRTIMEQLIIPAALKAIDLGLTDISHDLIDKEISRLRGCQKIKTGEILSLQKNNKGNSRIRAAK